MAKFNPDTNNVGTQNYIGYSQGQTPNRGLGLLFGALADTIQTGLEERSNRDKLNLQRDADQAVQDLDQEVLNGGQSDTPDNTGPSLYDTPKYKGPTTGPAAVNLPSDLNSAPEEIKKLNIAKEQGVMSDIDYTKRVMLISKRLRIKYPQYGPEIDDLLSNATGTSFANQLRKQELAAAEADTAAMSAEQKRKYQLLKETNLYLGDDTTLKMYEKLAGKPFNMDDFDEKAWLYATGVREFEVKDLDLKKKRLELDDALNKRDDRLAKQTATEEVIKLRDRLLFTTMNTDLGTSKSFKDLEQMVNSANSDGIFTKEEELAIVPVINELEKALKIEAEKLLTGTDKDGFSYAKYLSNTEREDMKTLLLQPLSIIKDGINNRRTATLTILRDDNEAKTLQNKNKLLNDPDTQMSELITTAKKIYGDQVVESAALKILAGEKGETKEERAVMAKLLMMGLSGQSFTETIKEGQKNGSIKSGKSVAKSLSTYADILLSPNVSEKTAIEAAKKLYDDREKDLTAQFDPDSRRAVFDIVFNENLWNKIKGDKETADRMYTWGMYQAKTLMEPLADTMANSYGYFQNNQIFWDEKSGLFVMNNTPTPAESLTGVFYLDAHNRWRAQQAVDQMNSYLVKMKPVVEGNGDTMQNFLSILFVGNDFKQLNKKGSVFESLGKSFIDRVQGIAKEIQEKAKELGPPPEGFWGSTYKAFEKRSEGPSKGNLVAYSRKTDMEDVQITDEYSYKKRRGRPNQSVIDLVKAAAADSGLQKIAITSGKGNYISPSGRRRGQKTTQHSTGNAVDVGHFDNDAAMYAYIENAVANGAKGIGIYGNGTVHIDTGRERHWAWNGQEKALAAAIARGKKKRERMMAEVQ